MIREQSEENQPGRTMDEFEVLADICTPAAQIMVHPHGDH